MAQFILQLDDRGLKAGFVDFKKANALALTRTLSIQAALTRKNAIKNIKEDMTLRNTFTTRNIQFDKAQETSVTSQAFRAVARAGATKRAPYMALQETGGRKKTRTGAPVAIGQRAARLGSSKNVISKRYYLRKMRQNNMVTSSKSRKYSSRKARNVARMAVAFEKKKFIKSGDGIFEVTSFQAGKGRRPKIKMRLLYTTGHENVIIRPKPWLLPATRKPVADGPNIYKSQLKKLFRSAKII